MLHGLAEFLWNGGSDGGETLQAVCYRAGEKTGKIVVEDRKERGTAYLSQVERVRRREEVATGDHRIYF